MEILLLFSFLAGVVTILSPCILPVLPIILTGSVGEGRARPVGIVLGFVLSFTIFTLFLSAIVSSTGFSAEVLRMFAVLVIVSVGLVLVIPKLQLVFERAFSFFSRFAPQQQHPGFFGGVLVGLSLGLIWTPCVGPILAAIISLAISGSVSGSAVAITLGYALGTALPMFAIMIGGRTLITRVPGLLANTAKIQQVFGAIMILLGLSMLLNFDRAFQAWVLDTFPEYSSFVTQIEEVEIVKDNIDILREE